MTNQSNSTQDARRIQLRRTIGLLASIALIGCSKPAPKTPAPTKQASFWYPILVDADGTLSSLPCIPADTKTIEPETPTLFGMKNCPKGWRRTNMYFKQPREKPKGSRQ